MSIFLKNNFCKPKFIHKSFEQCFHVYEVSMAVPVTVIYVVSSSLFNSANIVKKF